MLGFISRRFPIVGVLGGLALLAWGFSRGSIIPEVAGGIVAVIAVVRMVGSAAGKNR